MNIVQLRPRKSFMLAALCYAALTLFTTRPIVLNPTATYERPYDGLLVAYMLSWNLHQLTTDPLNLFQAPFFHPQPDAFALSENLLGLSLLTAPLYAIFREPLLQVNAVLLGSFFSLALVAHWVLVRWTRSSFLALLGGLYVGFALPRFGQLHHIHLLSYQPLLLALYCAERWIRLQSGRAAFGFWLMFVVQFYFGIYLFLFHTIVMLAFVPLLLLVHRRRIAWGGFVKTTLLGLALSSIAILPVAAPYISLRSREVLTPPLAHLAAAGARFSDFLVFPPHHLLASLTKPFLPTSAPWPWEHHLALAPSLLILTGVAIVGLVIKPKRSARLGLTLGLFAAAALCLLLSLGSRLVLNEHPTGIPLPFALFHHCFPGFSVIRVPTRFILPVSALLPCFALVVLAPLWRKFRSRALVRMGAGCCCLLALAELAMHPLPLHPLPTRDALPTVIQSLEAQTAGLVVFWPMSRTEEFEYMYMFYNTRNWLPMLNGRSGYMPGQQAAIYHYLTTHFPEREAFDLLRELQVLHIVVAGEFFKDPAKLATTRNALDALAQQGLLKRWYADDLNAGYSIIYR